MNRGSQRETRTPEYRSGDSDLDRTLSRAVQDSAERVGARVAAALAAAAHKNEQDAKLPHNA